MAVASHIESLPAMKRSEIKLVEQAMRHRWPMSAEQRDEIIQRMLKIISDPMSSNREVTAATRALLAAEAQNQQDELHAATEFREKLLAYADRMGIDIEAIGGQAEGSPSQDASRIADGRDA